MIARRDADTLRAHALVAEAEGLIADAIALLSEAAEAAPGFALAHAELAQLLQRAGRSEEALHLLDARIRQFPEPAWPRSIKAALLDAERRTEESLPVHQDIVARIPHIALAWLNYGQALRAVGRIEEAIAAFRKTVELEPSNGAAWWALASVATAALGPTDAEQMERALESAEEVQCVPLHFALGRALEQAGDFERSFRHYDAGNRLRSKLVSPASAGLEELVSRSEALFTRQFLADRAGGGCIAQGPIFIVGMPRSGSTLVEQMLASHPWVEALGELPHLPEIARKAGGIEGVANLTSDELAGLGERYLESARRYRRTDQPHFTDKLPANWQWIGLIRLMLPNAKIIDVRRDPMACCFANFALYFNRQTNLASGLEDLARTYLAYTRMVDHFRSMLPDQVVTISYERLVEHPDETVRSMLTFLGVRFHADCLRPFENERAVHTPSAEQVRRPIHCDANQRWRSYEPWLALLSATFGPISSR